MSKRGPQPKFNDNEKWCAKCKAWLPLDNFGDNKNTASGKAYYCKPCHSSYCRQFWTSVKAYERIMMREYKLSPEEYITLWNHQNKKCAVCLGDITLYNRNTQIDYDGSRVKGLLCLGCYSGLEKIQSLENLLRAVAYKERP